MKVEVIDLHGKNLNESRETVQQNIDWAIKHGVEVLVLNHGKGYHSSGFAVLKTELRQMLNLDLSLQQNGYRVIYGESNLPIALTYNAGNTLIVARGMENHYIGGQSRQEINQRIFSEEGRQERKDRKHWRRDR